MSESVIVAPGLWMPGLETKLLRYRLANAGFNTYSFEFPSMRGTLERNAQLLARFIQKMQIGRAHV